MIVDMTDPYYTYEEIAKILDITPIKVQEIEQEALHKLKYNKQAYELFEAYIKNIATFTE